MRKPRLAPDAEIDLIEIRRYTIEHWNSAQAKKYTDDLQQTFRLLAATPALGKPRPELGDGYLSFPHESHIIYYFTTDELIVVIGVLHKRMAPQKHLADRAIM